MYEAFYGLSEKPFSLLPDPAFLYQSEKHSTALSLFEYSLAGQAGFCVVTGEVGAGKTTLIRHFLQNFGLQTTIGIISNPHPGFGDLLDWVANAFGIDVPRDDKVAAYRAFVGFLLKQEEEDFRTILVVDEAQNLSAELLEQLRLLSNVNTDKRQLLQMILVGQPELLEQLQRPELRQFTQRISVHYHLPPLTYDETRNYIRHRLAVAGAERRIFAEAAVAGVHYLTGGVPRLINAVCDMALVYGYGVGRDEIDLELVLDVVADREKGALLNLPRSLGATSREQLLAELRNMMKEAQAHKTNIRPGSPSPSMSNVVVTPREFAVPRAARLPDAPEPAVGKAGAADLPVDPLDADSSVSTHANARPLRATLDPEVRRELAKPRKQWKLWKLS